MGIIAINVNTTGLIGAQINPRRCTFITTDSLATITTAGYLNNQNLLGNTILPTDVFEVLYLFNEQTQVGIFGIFQVTYSSSTGFTLNLWENPGNVLLPVVSGDFAVFNGTSGQIKDAGYLPSDATKTVVVMAGSAVVANRIAHFVDTAGTLDDTAANVTNLGNIIAGASGTAGVFQSFPATAANGSFSFTAVGNAGNFASTVSPISTLGQATVYTIPDPGASTASFVLSASAGTQTITGNLTVSGAITSTAGNITSGSGGDAGTFISFPATTANGTLIIAAANAGGAFNTTISNGTMAQSTVYTIPDVTAATGQFLVKTAALVSGNLIKASGTAGVVVDAGFAVLANTTAAYGGGGVSNAFTATGLTTSSIVTATILTSTNAVAIAKAVPTANTLTVTFTGDPGAATTVSWIAITPAV